MNASVDTSHISRMIPQVQFLNIMMNARRASSAAELTAVSGIRNRINSIAELMQQEGFVVSSQLADEACRSWQMIQYSWNIYCEKEFHNFLPHNSLINALRTVQWWNLPSWKHQKWLLVFKLGFKFLEHTCNKQLTIDVVFSYEL